MLLLFLLMVEIDFIYTLILHIVDLLAHTFASQDAAARIAVPAARIGP